MAVSTALGCVGGKMAELLMKSAIARLSGWVQPLTNANRYLFMCYRPHDYSVAFHHRSQISAS